MTRFFLFWAIFLLPSLSYAQTSNLNPAGLSQLYNSVSTSGSAPNSVTVTPGASLFQQQNQVSPPKVDAQNQEVNQEQNKDSPNPSENLLKQYFDPGRVTQLEQELQPRLPIGSTAPLRLFGYTQLASQRFEYDPVANPGLPDGYLLGPGDEITVHDSLGQGGAGTSIGALPLKVDPSGQLHIPGVQPIQAWNLTLDQLNQELTEKTKFLYATLGRVRSIQINIAGEAVNPGLHRIPATATAINALVLTGGVRKTGSLRQIKWFRGRTLVRELDLYDYLLNGRISPDLRLQSGDTLFIPLLKDAVGVSGAVRRPGIYELSGERNLAQVIEMAGGVAPGVSLERIQLERQDSLKGTTMLTLSGSELEASPVQVHDILKVLPRPALRNVRIEGNAVANAGQYPMLPGMKLADLLIAAGGLVHPESTDPRVLLSRWEYKDGRSQRAVYSLTLNPKTLETQPKLELQNGDAFTLRFNADYAKPEFVKLSGEFRYPGTYEILPGERISDLIRRAGGFAERAFLPGAVFTRPTLAVRERVVDQRLSSDIDKALLQSTVRAPASLTSPETQLAAVREIRSGFETSRQSEQQIAATTALAAAQETRTGEQRDQAISEAETLTSESSSGRVLIQLQDLDIFETTVDDVELRDGDSLYIPAFQNTVLVKGETFGEASLAVQEGKTVDYYLEQFGGVRASANPDEIYIIRANGRVESNAFPDGEIVAGDTIIVPPDLTPKESIIKEYASVVDILFKTVTTIALLYTTGLLVP